MRKRLYVYMPKQRCRSVNCTEIVHLSQFYKKKPRTKHSLNITINPVLAGSFNPDPSGNHILIEISSCNKNIKALKIAVNAVDRNTTGMQFLTRFVYQLLLKYALSEK